MVDPGSTGDDLKARLCSPEKAGHVVQERGVAGQLAGGCVQGRAIISNDTPQLIFREIQKGRRDLRGCDTRSALQMTQVTSVWWPPLRLLRNRMRFPLSSDPRRSGI